MGFGGDTGMGAGASRYPQFVPPAQCHYIPPDAAYDIGCELYHGLDANTLVARENFMLQPTHTGGLRTGQHRGKETVGSVQVGKNPKKHAGIEGYTGLAQDLRAVELPEIGMVR